MSKYTQNYARYILADYSEKVFIYLPGATVKAAKHDIYRDIGYVKGQQNYLTVNAWVRPMVSNELIVRQLGIISIGSVKMVVKNNDVPLFKLAARIVYKKEDFYVYNDTVGNKMIMVNLDDNYTEITIFKKDI